jgi:hypothetical protein
MNLNLGLIKQKNSPIFTRKFIQPGYNQKAPYLPIQQKQLPCKCLNNSDIQKSQNLRTDSMTGAISWAVLERSSPNIANKVYTSVDPVLCCKVDQLPVGDWL